MQSENTNTIQNEEQEHIPRTRHVLEFSMAEQLEHGQVVSNLTAAPEQSVVEIFDEVHGK